MTVRLRINDRLHTLELDSDTPLLYVLRNDLGLYGAKFGCGLEQCGACVVLVDGEPAYSCTRRVGDLEGRAIETVEHQPSGRGTLEHVQQAFVELNAAQCGFCTAGLIMRSAALLTANPTPTRADICAALDGHLCRCGSQPRVVRAVQLAAERSRASES